MQMSVNSLDVFHSSQNMRIMEGVYSNTRLFISLNLMN